jgi:hypothetical protein
MSIPSPTQNPTIISFESWRTITEPEVVEGFGPQTDDQMRSFYEMWVRQVTKIGELDSSYIEKYCTEETYLAFSKIPEAERMQMGIDFINEMDATRDQKLEIIRSVLKDVAATSGEDLPFGEESVMAMAEMFIK